MILCSNIKRIPYSEHRVKIGLTYIIVKPFMIDNIVNKTYSTSREIKIVIVIMTNIDVWKIYMTYYRIAVSTSG